jgi:hypothetical protein
MATHAQPRRSVSPSAGMQSIDGGLASAPSSDEASRILVVSDRRASLTTRITLGMSRKLWQHRAETWAQDRSVALCAVVDAVIAESCDLVAEVAVDLGCGSGRLTLPLACHCDQVLAVDIDAGAIDLLRHGPSANDWRTSRGSSTLWKRSSCHPRASI